jgi:TolB-like protein
MRYSPRNMKVACDHAGLTHVGGIHFFHEFIRVLQLRHFLATHLALPRRGYRFIAKVERSAYLIRSLAVLPLANLSSDPEQEYFVEGLTEALITTLAKIGELRIVSRTSSMQYKDASKRLGQIARELDVDAIVEGTVLRAHDRVRITAQLIDAAKESHLWAESYERDLRDVLALQSEVAQAIAQEIQVRLTPQEKAQFDQINRVDPVAYEAYLKGRYYWNRRSHEGFHKGVQHFREAIVKDPTFASAYSGLADCLSLLTLFGFVASDDGIARAKELAQRALELDPASAEAHASRAMIDTWYEFDFSAAERGFERSIELNPRYAIGHSRFGFHLGLMGAIRGGLYRMQTIDSSGSCLQPQTLGSSRRALDGATVRPGD